MILLTSSHPGPPAKTSDPQPPLPRQADRSGRTRSPRSHRTGLIAACLAGLFAIGTASAQDRPQTLHLCFDNDPNNEPTIFALLNRVSARLAVNFDIARVPWARCLVDVQNGDRDGAIGASYLPVRDAIGVFPLDPQGKPDPTKRISVEGYYLYTRKDSTLDWDGNQLTHLTGSVAVKINAAIVTKLKSLGAPLLEVNSDWESLMEMVVENHAQAATMLADRGDRILLQNKELAANMRKIPIALQEKPYYLMLSHQLREVAPHFADDLWDAIRTVRDSAEYQQAIPANGP